MTIPFGINSMVRPLQHVLVQAPTDAFEWAFEDPELGFLHEVDLDAARKEHEHFCEILEGLGASVHHLSADSPSPDLIYTYDPSLITVEGAIILRSGKPSRRGEQLVHAAWYSHNDVPIVGTIEAPGTVDGGDVMWVADDVMAIGRSSRTNQAGVDQLIEILDQSPHVVDVSVQTDVSVMHLMSSLSMVSDDLAVVESQFLPTDLKLLLGDLGVKLIEIPPSESASLAANVLAVKPGVVVVVDGNPITRAALEAEGVEVHVMAGTEIALNGTGGPTCLTRPLLRA